ncbi:MAG TPA: hypothetical protein PLI19_06605 [Erysipelotrichaceae bacterium]|nr:hypothetical protein [Erysipelotrichaceae bacterium]HQB32986.1 hypothetical protein [Erysipelotrichaceae bacterium]
MERINDQQKIRLGKIIYSLQKKDNYNLLRYYISRIINLTDDVSLSLRKLEIAVNNHQTDLELLLTIKEIHEEISDTILDRLCAFYNDNN